MVLEDTQQFVSRTAQRLLLHSSGAGLGPCRRRCARRQMGRRGAQAKSRGDCRHVLGLGALAAPHQRIKLVPSIGNIALHPRGVSFVK